MIIRRVVLALAIGCTPIALGAQVPVTGAATASSDTVHDYVHFRLPAADFDVGHARWPAAMQWPWVNGIMPRPGAAAKAFDEAIAALMAARRDDALRAHLLRTAADLVESRPGVVRERGLFGLSSTTADLTFDERSSLGFDISTSRQRNLTCTPDLVQNPLSGCTGGFTPPKIDNTLMLGAIGVIGQRVHINIDLDTKRDFGNNNLIQAYYLGLPDEVVKEVNLGSVQFHAPPSRFLAAAIPTNNFGIDTKMELGPFSFEAIAATQKGSMLTTRYIRIGEQTTQPQDRIVRDLEFQAGKFFWLVDPESIPGFPAVDVLNLGGVSLSPAVQPTGQVRVYRYTSASASNPGNPNANGITARGVNGTESVGPLRWALLKPNYDYWVDPSGLWMVLRVQLDPNDFLAVSYQTVSGGKVGTFPAADDPARADTLLLIKYPNRGPESPTFRYAMRQVYHVAGKDLTRGSVTLSIAVARSERPEGGTGTYLSLLGLALPSDQATFDADNRLFPRVRDPGADQVVEDVFIVFPNAKPFADPVRLPANVRADSLYRTPEYLLFTEGPPSTFALNLHYEAASTGNRNGFSLDASQIKEGSEQIYVNDVLRAKDVDYRIDYNTGRVLFVDPTSLLGRGVANVTAKFEQQGFFAVAPTSIAGLTATWKNRFGELSAAGLYQAEATAFNRPFLGYEPRSSLITGFTGREEFNLPVVTRLINQVVPRHSTAPSRLSLQGELAFSRPNPNRSGSAYLEEFENDGALEIPMFETSWVPGSLPTNALGLGSIAGFSSGFDPADAVQLIWQSYVPDANGDPIQLSPQDIDTTIKLTSSVARRSAPVLFMTLHADTAGGLLAGTSNHANWSLPKRPFAPRWRTMQTSLSPTGIDLTHNSAIEFWLFEGVEGNTGALETNHTTMVFDLGKVSEDALAIAPDSLSVQGTDSVWTGRQYVGLGHLNTERTAFGTWNAITDDIGVLADRPDSVVGPGGVMLYSPVLCRRTLSSELQLLPWGDLGAPCSVGNGGVPDGEDLDGDLVLDAQGSNDDVFRYVVDLADTSFRVRSRTVTAKGKTSRWALYRVPLRDPTATIGNPNMRLIKSMRVAILTPTDNGSDDPVIRFAFALLRLTGAPWITRAPAPIEGISGSTAEPQGSVTVASISTQDVEVGYTPPPGVAELPANLSSDPSQLAQQVNEKSLRIIATNLDGGRRAEGYNRLISGAQNLQAYRQLRVWVRGHGPGWDAGPLRAYVKVGSDAFNFYMYQAPASTSSWDQELVVDLDVWRRLRTEVELRVYRDEPPSGAAACGAGDPTAYVACDGGYLVQVRDPRVNPPNLVAVQEVAVGMLNTAAPGGVIGQTELWVDDIRLDAPVSTTGVAGALSARLAASDVVTLDANYVSQDGNFRQIGQAPTYRGTRTVSMASTIHIDRFLPPSFGIGIPFTISHASGRVDPTLLTGSDVASAELVGFRRPSNAMTQWSLSIRRTAVAGRSALLRYVVNPLSFAATGSSATALTELSESNASSWNSNVAYSLSLQRGGRSLGLGSLVRRLPRWLRESDGGKSLSGSRLALLPTALRFSSSLSRAIGDFTSFAVPIERLADTILRPLSNEQYLWRNGASLNWQPVGLISASSDWQSNRDLRRYADTTSLGRLAGASRLSFLGADVGVERDRTISNRIQLAPGLARWLHPRLLVSTGFVLSRSLTSRNPVRVDGDTAGAYILPQTLNNSRQVELGLNVDPAFLIRDLFGDSSKVTNALQRLRSIQLTRTRSLQSTFDLATFDPSLGYQMGLGSFDAFLSRGGQRAIGAVRSLQTVANGSLDLPGGFGATFNYQLTDFERYQRNVSSAFLVTTTRQSSPGGSLVWSRTFGGGPLTFLNSNVQLQKQTASSITPAETGDPTSIQSTTHSITPILTLSFRNNVSLTMRGRFDRSNAEANGNTTRGNTDDLAAQASWITRLPRRISRLRRSLTSRLSVAQRTDVTCLQRVADSLCVPYSDIHRLDMQGSFSADLATALQTSLQVSWVLLDVRNLQRKTSSMTIGVQMTVPLNFLGM